MSIASTARRLTVAAIVALAAATTGATESSRAANAERFCAPGDAAELLDRQIAWLEELNASPQAGVGTGRTASANSGRFGSLQARLQQAQGELAEGRPDVATSLVGSALQKTDGQPSPPDWLAGAEAATFEEALGCVADVLVNGPADRLHAILAPFGGVGTQSISSFDIGAGGALAFLYSSVAGGEHDGGESLAGFAASRDGRLVFVGHPASREIEAFGRRSDGSLVSTDIVATRNNGAVVIEAHPTLPLLYVADFSFRTGPFEVTVFSYDRRGALTPIQTIAVARDLRDIDLTDDGRFLVAAHIGFIAPARLDVYSIGIAGTLTSIPVASMLPAGAGRISDVVAAGGRVYGIDLDRGIYAYDLAAGGMLTPLNAGLPFRVRGSFLADASVKGDRLVALSLSPVDRTTHLEVFPIIVDGLGTPTVASVQDVLFLMALNRDGTAAFAVSRGFVEHRVRSFRIDPDANVAVVGDPLSFSAAPGAPVGLLVSD